MLNFMGEKLYTFSVNIGIIDIKKKFVDKYLNSYFINTVSKGFTQAEMFVTIAIIGVVAAIVLPIIMNSAQESELRALWRKNFNDLSEATRLIAAEQEGIRKLDDADSYMNLLLSHMNYSKMCVQARCSSKIDGTTKIKSCNSSFNCGCTWNSDHTVQTCPNCVRNTDNTININPVCITNSNGTQTCFTGGDDPDTCPVGCVSDCNKVCDKDGICGCEVGCWHNEGALKLFNGGYYTNAGWSYRASAILSNGALLFLYRYPDTVCQDSKDACLKPCVDPCTGGDTSKTSVCTTQCEALNPGCTANYNSCTFHCNLDVNAPDARCAHIYMDVNGFKKPNVVGKDVFGMILYSDSLRPMGGGMTCGSGTGTECSAYWLLH